MMAIMPAKIGASKLVPPATVKFTSLLSRKPFEQLPVICVDESLEQYKNPALFGDAVREMSGTRRKVPDGIPVTLVCHEGRAVSVLIPPPPAESPAVGSSSFQTCSGM